MLVSEMCIKVVIYNEVSKMNICFGFDLTTTIQMDNFISTNIKISISWLLKGFPNSNLNYINDKQYNYIQTHTNLNHINGKNINYISIHDILNNNELSISSFYKNITNKFQVMGCGNI